MDIGEAGDRGSVLTGHDDSGIPGDSGDEGYVAIVLREMVTGREGYVDTTHHGDIRLTGHQGHMTTPSNQNWREFSLE